MNNKPPIWRSSLFLGWLAASAVFGALGATVKPFGNLGYEFALLISLAASLGAGQLAACYPGRVREQMAGSPGARTSPLSLYARALGINLPLLAVPFGIALLVGLYKPPCNQVEGAQLYLAMPVLSVLLATAVGQLAGFLSFGPVSASILWFLLFAASIAAAIYRLYSTPAVFLFGPFFGYYPGVLYDELVRFDSRLVTYRAAGLLQTGFLVAFMGWLVDPATLRLSLQRVVKARSAGLWTLALALMVLAAYLAEPLLGHRTERARLEALLSTSVERNKLALFFPPDTEKSLVDGLADDAAFSLYQVQSYFEIPQQSEIAVFFFKSALQRSEAMGAYDTNVTKPWRSEIYLVIEEPPHDVLRHELVHAVLAQIGSGPFAVAGSLGGLFPNPGFIEGMAVAAEGPRRDLTVHQAAAAMNRAGLLPSLEKIFGLGFFTINAGSAYTAAGSFIAWARDRYGIDVLKKAYLMNHWQRATGEKLDQLEKRWREFLGGVAIRPEDVEMARHRFDRPAILASACVHEVARLAQEADRFSETGNFEKALVLCAEAAKKSGGSAATRLKLFYALVDTGRTKSIRAEAQSLLGSRSMPTVDKDKVTEVLADLDIAGGAFKEAKRVYADLALRATVEDDRRSLEVKAYLAGLADPAQSRMFDILARRPGPKRVSSPLSMLVIAELALSRPEDPVFAYLMGRQYFNCRGYGEAIAWLDRAEAKGLAGFTASLWLAARMLKGQALFHQGKSAEASAMFKLLENDKSISQAAREKAADWRERVLFFGK